MNQLVSDFSSTEDDPFPILYGLDEISSKPIWMKFLSKFLKCMERCIFLFIDCLYTLYHNGLCNKFQFWKEKKKCYTQFHSALIVILIDVDFEITI
jgi:hypothetical protein